MLQPNKLKLFLIYIGKDFLLKPPIRATDYGFALATLGDVIPIDMILSNLSLWPNKLQVFLIYIGKVFLLKPPMRATDYGFALATLGDVTQTE
jgi:hypothetical protein